MLKNNSFLISDLEKTSIDFKVNSRGTIQAKIHDGVPALHTIFNHEYIWS